MEKFLHDKMKIQYLLPMKDIGASHTKIIVYKFSITRQ